MHLYPDVMVDIETTGTQPDQTAIIQLAAVRFNLETKEVDPKVFDMAMRMPPTRYWDESTREWWSKMPTVLDGIWSRMQDPKAVMQAFSDWVVRANPTEHRLWAKPISFEWPFLQGYFREFEVMNPFHFRTSNDLNTFIRARHFPEAPPNYEKTLPFQGDEHNALHDVLHQIKVLFAAYEATK